MKGSMFEEEKNDILKDMYGEDISMVDEAELSPLSTVTKKEQAPQNAAPNRSNAAKTWAKNAMKPAGSTAAAGANAWRSTSAASAQKPVKSGNGWLVLGLVALIGTAIMAPAIAYSSLQSVLWPGSYEEKLAEMLDKNQPARAIEFIRENQLDNYDRSDASYAPLVTQAQWEDRVLDTIDQWQFFVSVIAGEREADLSDMTWDLATNMEMLCTPDEDLTAAVDPEDVQRGRDAVRGMLLVLGDDGAVFEALCSDDYGIRSAAADVIESTLDDLAIETGNSTQEDVFFSDESIESTAPLSEEV